MEQRPDTPTPRPRPIADLASALGLLTVLPVGRSWPDGVPPRATGWYPWAGWAVGGVMSGAACAAALAGTHVGLVKALLAGTLAVVAGALFTRGLHWDGLADTADGLGGAFDRARRLEIMHDSATGAFGATAVVLIALVQAAAIAACVVARASWVIPVAAVLARAAVAGAAWTLAPARAEGLGAAVAARPGPYDVTVGALGVAALATLVLVGAPPLGLAVAAGSGAVAAALVPRALARAVGGVTGDVMGATVLLVETVVLVSGAMWL